MKNINQIYLTITNFFKIFFEDLQNESFFVFVVIFFNILPIWSLPIDNTSGKILGAKTAIPNYRKILNDNTPPTIYTDKINFEEDSENYIYLKSDEELHFGGLPSFLTIDSEFEFKNGLYTYLFFSQNYPSENTTKIYAYDEAGNPAEIYLFFNLNNFDFNSNAFNKLNCTHLKEENLLLFPIDKVGCSSDTLSNIIDLTSLKYNDQEIKINTIIEKDLKKLLTESTAAGLNISITSAYRSNTDQKKLIEDMKNLYGETAIEDLVAQEGFSEHALGTALDFGTNEHLNGQKVKFGKSKSFRWMKANAWKYGFVQSYPEDSAKTTGFRHEPWHWRYVGKLHARNIYTLENITLHEYQLLFLELYS